MCKIRKGFCLFVFVFVISINSFSSFSCSSCRFLLRQKYGIHLIKLGYFFFSNFMTRCWSPSVLLICIWNGFFSRLFAHARECHAKIYCILEIRKGWHYLNIYYGWNLWNKTLPFLVVFRKALEVISVVLSPAKFVEAVTHNWKKKKKKKHLY